MTGPTERAAGGTVTIRPAVTEFDGDLVRDWQIYIDLAPVFA